MVNSDQIVRKLYAGILNSFLILLTPIMMVKLVMITSNCASPFVLSAGESMQPTLSPGTILFLSNNGQIQIGDIIIFELKDTEYLIGHRVVGLSKTQDGSLRILTKGDNNLLDDRSIYGPGKQYLNQDDVVGRVAFIIPHIGVIFTYIKTQLYLKMTMVIAVAILLCHKNVRLTIQLVKLYLKAEEI